MKRCIPALVLAACVALEPAAARGVPDGSFGDNGVVRLPWRHPVAVGTSIVPAPDGGAYFVRMPGEVTRLAADGTHVATVNVLGTANLFTIAEYRDELARIAVAGWGAAPLPTEAHWRAVDPSSRFMLPGSRGEGCTTGRPGNVMPGHGGQTFIYASEDAWQCGRVWRLAADGAPDRSFGGEGYVTLHGKIRDLRPLPDGGVEVLLDAHPEARYPARLVSLASTGEIATSVDISTPRERTDFGGDGGILLPGGGRLLLEARDGALAVSRYLPAELQDFSFGVGGVARVQVRGLQISYARAWVAEDGYLIAASATSKSAPWWWLVFIKLDADGQLDPEFGQGGFLQRVDANSALVGATMQPDGYFMFAMERREPGAPVSAAWTEAERMQVVADLVELHHPGLDRYLLVSAAHFRRMREVPGAGGWRATGERVRPGGTTRTCVFRARNGSSASSLFYSADAAECEAVRNNPGWAALGEGFHTTPPRDGGCPAQLRPVHRLHNARSGTNHRYVVRESIIAPMQAEGWTYEGVAFCAKP
jgi:hypothetical protein